VRGEILLNTLALVQQGFGGLGERISISIRNVTEALFMTGEQIFWFPAVFCFDSADGKRVGRKNGSEKCTKRLG
jgi:hypothetical protein